MSYRTPTIHRNPYSTKPFVVGALSNAPTLYEFDGMIDEVALYSYRLTPAEIVARYMGGPPITPEPCTMLMLGGGLLALAARRRRSR